MCSASCSVPIADLMCLGPTVQKSAADSWRSLGCFYARLLYINTTRCSEVSRETDYRLKAKLLGVGNKFSFHME